MTLAFGLLLALGAQTPAAGTVAAPQAPEAAATPEKPGTATALPGASAPNAAELTEPPPSTYDLERQRGHLDAGEHSEISWGAQLIKTVVALLVVIGLVYLVFKVGLARFMGVINVRAGKTLKVSERVQLDARHAMFIVELDGDERLLLATGEQGVQLLTRLGRGKRSDFQSVLEGGSKQGAGPGEGDAQH